MRIYGSAGTIRRGLTGREYLSQFLYEYFPNVSWEVVISDSVKEFGYLVGDSNEIARAITAFDQHFSFTRLTEFEFAGAVEVAYNPSGTMPDGSSPPSTADLLTLNEITVPGDLLDAVKAYKVICLKQILRKKFCDDNDAIADMAKISAVTSLYEDGELTAEQITRRDALKANLKAIYTIDMCLDGGENMVALLSGNVVGYYTSKAQVMTATDKASVMAVSYE